ncbi:MAG: phytanoyl-CoA dioxygenase family protein [Phycisphaeraceae bacterium]
MKQPSSTVTIEAQPSAPAPVSPVPPAPTVSPAPATARPVDAMLEYLFDLRGYVVLKGALDRDHLAQLNGSLDHIMGLTPPLRAGEWYGCVHAHSFGGKDGTNLQQIYEAGEPFERLIDHPNWFELVKHFVGGKNTFDWHHGPLFIDENFANLRGPGEAIGIHSGGHEHTKRGQFRFHNYKFQCGQVNVLMALGDIGPGDGATMLIPGSHKSNLEHPQFRQNMIRPGEATSADSVAGAIEVHLDAGDALLFVDACCHGSAKRVNPGQRRIIVYRYGPSWGNFRHPYYPSRELLERLTPTQRQVVLPQGPIKREPNRLPGTPNPPHAI